MQLTQEQVKAFIADGGASAINAAKSEADRIAGQINAGLSENEVKKVTYTIQMKIKVEADVEQRKVVITGSYGAKTPNLGKEGEVMERVFDDPNQMKLPLDGTTEKPEDDEPEE